MLGKAIDGFYRRVWLATQTDGRHFKHLLKDKRRGPPEPADRTSELIDLPIISDSVADKAGVGYDVGAAYGDDLDSSDSE